MIHNHGSLLLADLDRTTLKTDQYAHDVAMQIARSANLSETVEQEIQTELGRIGESVDMDSLFLRHGVDMREVLDAIDSLPDEYLYRDTQPLLGRFPYHWIVTTALNMFYQHKKLQHVGLDAVATVVQGNKGEYIRDRLIHLSNDRLMFPDFSETQSFESITVVDDRFDAVEKLIGIDGLRIIVLQRSDAKYGISPSQARSVEVVEALDEIR